MRVALMPSLLAASIRQNHLHAAARRLFLAMAGGAAGGEVAQLVGAAAIRPIMERHDVINIEAATIPLPALIFGYVAVNAPIAVPLQRSFARFQPTRPTIIDVVEPGLSALPIRVAMPTEGIADLSFPLFIIPNPAKMALMGACLGMVRRDKRAAALHEFDGRK